MSDPEREYGIHVSDPYLTTDWEGNYVILRDEKVFSAPKGLGVDQFYETETLVDDHPTEEEIFRLKLKGAVRL